jgi:hypothetical protein
MAKRRPYRLETPCSLSGVGSDGGGRSLSLSWFL